MKEYKYIIGSGWWCTHNEKRDSKFLNGDDAIRGVEFNKIWCDSIERYTNPVEVVVIDSASPIKPCYSYTNLPIKVIELPSNLGHASSLKGDDKFCGWTASVLLSMEYASFSNADYYVYIEQDALVFGKDIIEYCIDYMESKSLGYLMGRSDNNIQPLEQSFFVVKKTELNKFLSRYRGIVSNDLDISPEFKFALAMSPVYSLMPEYFIRIGDSLYSKVARRFFCSLFKVLLRKYNSPIGFGRSRPVDFSDSYFYFQHGTKEEISQFLELYHEKTR